MDVIGNSWSIVVIHALRDRPRRPSDLREEIGGISAKVLTQALRRLEASGLVTRRVYAEAPPRVEYELTPLGRELLDPIDAIAEWAADHLTAIFDARSISSPA
jgi:DNA-binding HxlR family transcriptional regulator